MSQSNSVPDTMRAFRVHEYGENPTQVLQLESIAVPEPGAGELLVRVAAIPLNLNDMERVNGRNMMARPELPSTPGMEVMGTVVATGDGLEQAIGRRVTAMAKQAVGGFAEYAICPAVSAFDVPAEIPLPDAAAIYFPFHLAWLGLFDRAGLEAGESVLIHAAAGGSGSAAIQLAKDKGATVFAAVGSSEKVELCRELGADHVIDTSSEDFCEVVLEATGNRGVDVVFDNVGEAVMEKSIRCTAYNGRYLMMGFASDKSVADEKFIVPRRIATGNLHLCGVLLAYADAAMGPMMKKAMGWNFVPGERGVAIQREVVERVLDERVRPVIGSVADFEALPACLEAMRDRKSTGRIVVTTGLD